MNLEKMKKRTAKADKKADGAENRFGVRATEYSLQNEVRLYI